MPKVPLFTYKELSAKTGVKVGTLRAWRKRGKLPAPDFTVGQSPAWKPETVREWLAAREPQAPAAGPEVTA